MLMLMLGCGFHTFGSGQKNEPCLSGRSQHPAKGGDTDLISNCVIKVLHPCPLSHHKELKPAEKRGKRTDIYDFQGCKFFLPNIVMTLDVTRSCGIPQNTLFLKFLF